ncbi:MAG: hypothetical protein LBH38_02910 [Holosporales bacterium]|nr:hypothetical protein [Holosporales bacterium]
MNDKMFRARAPEDIIEKTHTRLEEIVTRQKLLAVIIA